MKNILLVIAISLVICYLMLGCSRATKMTVDEMLELAHSEKYNEMLKALSGYDICSSNDPKKLMLYIEALIETGNQLPKSMQNSSCPTHIREFATGYYLMLNGRFTDSILHFSSIGGTIDSTIWMTTAFLEYGLYTKDLSNYETSIRMLEGLKIYNQQNDIKTYPTERDLTYYQGWFLQSTSKTDELKKLLIEKGAFLTPYDKALFEVELFLREDEFEKAQQIINMQLERYPRNQTYLLYRGLMIRLTQGDEKWLQYLEGLLKKNTGLSLIESHFATGLIEDGQKEKGLQLLTNAAAKKQFHYESDLLSKYYSILYGSSTLKAKNLEAINNEQYAQLPYYHVILGQLYLINGEIDNAEKQLNMAKQLNPYADYVLWLELEILKRRGISEKAKSVLLKMRRVWPNDIDILHEECELDLKTNDMNDFWKINDIVRSSKRVVPSRYMKKSGGGCFLG